MKRTDFIKAKLAVTDKYLERNNGRAKEYAFSLPASIAAQLDYILEEDDNFNSLQELILFIVDQFFDQAVAKKVMKSNRFDLFESIKRMMRDE